MAAPRVLGLVCLLASASVAFASISAEEAALWNTHTYGVFQSGKQVGRGPAVCARPPPLPPPPHVAAPLAAGCWPRIPIKILVTGI
jgi:hypothetical protein